MGGVILLFLFILGLVILITPALKARARKRDEREVNAAHEDVMRRLEVHRKWRDGEVDAGADDNAPGRK